MKFKAVFIMFINILMLITLSNSKAYDYFGIYFGPENPSMLYFNVIDKDSLTKTCFLTSPELGINNVEANTFALTNKDFYYCAFSDKLEINIETRKKTNCFEGGGPIDGFVGKVTIYQFDKETLQDLNKYCGTYYSVDKKDSIVISINDSISIFTSHNDKNKIKEVNNLYPAKSDLFISNNNIQYQFKLRNFIPWQIMYVFEGQEYFFYKEL